MINKSARTVRMEIIIEASGLDAEKPFVAIFMGDFPREDHKVTRY